MSDNHDYLRYGEEDKFRMRADITMLMLRGAGYAAAVCLVVLFVMLAIYAVGKMLPEESRDTDDPTPFSYELQLDGDTYA